MSDREEIRTVIREEMAIIADHMRKGAHDGVAMSTWIRHSLDWVVSRGKTS